MGSKQAPASRSGTISFAVLSYRWSRAGLFVDPVAAIATIARRFGGGDGRSVDHSTIACFLSADKESTDERDPRESDLRIPTEQRRKYLSLAFALWCGVGTRANDTKRHGLSDPWQSTAVMA